MEEAFLKNHYSRQDEDFHDSQPLFTQVVHEATGFPVRTLVCR